jgi:hypothetical protein
MQFSAMCRVLPLEAQPVPLGKSFVDDSVHSRVLRHFVDTLLPFFNF